jgi:hypothetical protein
MCVVQVTCKDHKHAHPRMMFVQHLLRKTLAIGSIKVKWGEATSGGRSSEVGTHFARLAFRLFFFSSNFFFPDEKKILQRNPARKKRSRIEVDHLLQLQTGR